MALFIWSSALEKEKMECKLLLLVKTKGQIMSNVSFHSLTKTEGEKQEV